MCFQMTFAIITPALIAGAFAERMKFSAMLWFIGPVVDLRLRADRALGVGLGRLPVRRQLRRHDQGARLRRRHRRAYQRRRCRPDVRDLLGKRKDTGPGPQHGADLHRRLAAVGRLVRLQRRFGCHRRHAGRHGDDRHADRHRGRRASPGCSWSGSHRGKPTVIGICSGAVAGLVAITPASGFVGPVGSMVHRRRRRRRLLLGRHRPQAHARLSTTRSTASASMRSAASSARCSPACSRSASTAAPPA